MAATDLLLPEGAVLVHIGPYKTGTSALQMSMHDQRDELRRLGVLYPGPAHRPNREFAALFGRAARGLRPGPIEEWERFAAAVRSTDAARTCLSNEGIASARPAEIKRIVDDLGRDRVHMLVVARRLDKLIPSAWQERVKSSNETRSYADFLRPVLARDLDDRAAKQFWKSHAVETLVERWLAEVPPEQITVVVLDDTDRTRVSRTVESMLGLPESMLAATSRDNSSISWDKIEVYRAVNRLFDERGWPDAVRRRLIQGGMLVGFRGAPADPADAAIPGLDAAQQALLAELSRSRAEALRAAAARGVRVVGDPESLLTEVDATATAQPADPVTVPVLTAAHAVAGVVGAVVDREARATSAAPVAGRPALEDLSSRDLLREVVRRQTRRLRSR